MKDLNHYGVKGMEWGKRKKYDLVGNASTLSLLGNSTPLGKSLVKNAVTKSALPGNSSFVIGSLHGVASPSRGSSGRRSSGGSGGRKSPSKRRRSKGGGKERFIVDEISGKFDLSKPDDLTSNPKSRKNSKKKKDKAKDKNSKKARAKLNKKTSDVVKKNAKESVNSREALALIRQYKAFVDQLLKAFSMIGYSRQQNNSFVQQATNATEQLSKQTYTPGVAGPKIKTKKRG